MGFWRGKIESTSKINYGNQVCKFYIFYKIKLNFRSTPCPNVKHGEEWGEPGNCEQGDSCTYCHTRTEQQFHPEIYKSTKCNDVQQAGYCPRGVYCAFAHVDRECTFIDRT